MVIQISMSAGWSRSSCVGLACPTSMRSEVLCTTMKNCTPPPLVISPPLQSQGVGGGAVTWPKKYRKYWAPKAPKKIFTRRRS